MVPTQSDLDVFTIRSDEDPDGPPASSARLLLCGELDITATSALADAISVHVSSDRDVVLDCSRLAFVDAAGLGTILTSKRQAIRRGRTVRVLNVSPTIRHTIDLAGLGCLLEGADDGRDRRA